MPEAIIKKAVKKLFLTVYLLLSLFISFRGAMICAFIVRQEYGATSGRAAAFLSFILLLLIFGAPSLIGRRPGEK